MSHSPDVFLFRINDRPYGFRVVAVVHESQESAETWLLEKFGWTPKDKWLERHVRLEDRCSTGDGCYCQMEFEE